jgi:hypothetical protein
MNPNPTTRFYQVRAVEHRSEWARIWITDDGCISILSDYGNYGYWFGAPGGEFRRFLTNCGDDYITNKLSEGRRNLDQRATELNAKRLVLRARRDRSIDRETARDEWNAVRDVEWDNEYSRSKWYFEETKLVDYGATEVLVYDYPQQLQAFVRVLWPVFIAALTEEIKREEAAPRVGIRTPEALG